MLCAIYGTVAKLNSPPKSVVVHETNMDVQLSPSCMCRSEVVQMDEGHVAWSRRMLQTHLLRHFVVSVHGNDTESRTLSESALRVLVHRLVYLLLAKTVYLLVSVEQLIIFKSNTAFSVNVCGSFPKL